MVINQRQLGKQKQIKTARYFLFARLLLTLLSYFSWQACLFQREFGKEAK